MKEENKQIDIRIGSRLKQRRVLLGLSQAKLGEMLGVTFQQIQKYEKGVNRISGSTIERISKILLIPPSYFFDDDCNEYDDKEFRSVLGNLQKLSPDARKGVISLIKTLSEAENDK